MEKYLDKRLIIRQRMFLIIISILVIIDIINVISNKLSILITIGSFSLAIIIGLSLSRILKISWHQEKEKVISQLDTTGIIFLILYIGIRLSEKWIFQYWLSGVTFSTFALIILTGFLAGRFLGTFIRIKKVLSKLNLKKSNSPQS